MKYNEGSRPPDTSVVIHRDATRRPSISKIPGNPLFCVYLQLVALNLEKGRTTI